MNHARKKLSGSPLIPKGRAKKTRPKVKETPSALKELRERPPTRRNLNDVIVLDKIRNTPRSVRPASAKFKTSYSTSTTREKSLVTCEQHEYLQFSLRITEEIIRNDLYKNEEMVHVLKNHYQANKSRLNQDKLLKTIAELCSELNIPMNDNMLLFLEDRGSYSRVCLKDSFFSNSPEHLTKPIDVNNKKESAKLELRPTPSLVNESKPNLVSPIDIPSDIKISADANAVGDTGEDDTSKQESDLTIDEKSAPKEEVLQSPNATEDLCKSFEFGEETLKAPGEESIAGLDMKEFQVLHDATSKFNSDIDSDISIRFNVDSTTEDESKTQIGNRVTQMPQPMPSTKPDNKCENKTIGKNLVVSHYSTSLEPSLIETKDLSVQTNDKLTSFLADASTQKSLNTASLPSSPINNGSRTTVRTKQNNIVLDSEMPIDTIKIKCKQCSCDLDESRNEAPSSVASTFLHSADAQYILLDCPVLIPKEHTKSMDILTKRSVNFDQIGKSFHALNLRVPPAPFLPKSTMGSSWKIDKQDLHNSDIYDLTPQKDNLLPDAMDKHSPISPCSCTPSEANSKLLTDHYDRYRKVNENLSYFYPTIATQVSSMDLMVKDMSSLHRRETNFYQGRLEASPELKRNAATDGTPQAFNGLKKDAVNLDNYRIEPSGTGKTTHTGQKRHYNDDVVADREATTAKGGNGFNNEDTICVERSDRSERLPFQRSADSVERRIQNLRQDIEKYGKEDSLRNQGSQVNLTLSLRDGGRRGDPIEVFKQANTLLPSDMSLPKHRKMSVLRKQM